MAERLAREDALQEFDLLLLDTCVLIDEFKRPTGRLAEVNLTQRSTSIVAMWEFLHVTAGKLLPAKERADRRGWLNDQGILTLRLSERCGERFEGLLETEGERSLADSLLAAECLAREIPFATRNVKHFVTVPGLRLVEW
jgi:predicted nucleic acid-binding protein